MPTVNMVKRHVNQRSTSGSASQPIVAFIHKTQRASTSTRAPEAVVLQQATGILRARETLKLGPKFADEFSELGSMKIK